MFPTEGTSEPDPGRCQRGDPQAPPWLELLQISGPFLTLPVVHRVFPNGLAEVPAQDRAKVRGLVAQMMDDGGASRHKVIETLLRDVFDWQQHLVIDDAVPETLTEFVADHGVRLRPDFGYFDEDAEDADERPKMPTTMMTTTRTMPTRTNPTRKVKASPTPRPGRLSGGPWKLLGMVTVGDASADADLDRELDGERRRAAGDPAARP